MDLSDVQKIIETNRQADVNKHLECGWILLAIAPGQWPDVNEAYIKYSLGWIKEGEPVEPKEDWESGQL